MEFITITVKWTHKAIYFFFLVSQYLDGIGWIICDSSWSLIGLGCKRMQRNLGIKNLEANAIFKGVKAYTNWSSNFLRGFKPPLAVEIDAIEVVRGHLRRVAWSLGVVHANVRCLWFWSRGVFLHF